VLEFFYGGLPGSLELRDPRLVAIRFQLPLQVEIEKSFLLNREAESLLSHPSSSSPGARELDAISLSSISSMPRRSRSGSLRTLDTKLHTTASVSSARKFLPWEHACEPKRYLLPQR
jgi:hypothetical protein